MGAVLVTLQAEGFSKDFSLPADTALADLYPRLLSALRNVDEQHVFADYTRIVLESEDGGLLNESATLADYGVRDGWYLSIASKERYDGIG